MSAPPTRPGTAFLVLLALPLAAQEERAPAPAARLVTRHELPAGGFPLGVLAADLDLDGRDELVSVQRTPGGLAVWRGLGPGTSRLPAGEEPPELLPVGDFPVRPALLPRSGRTPLVASASRSELELELFDLAAPLADPRPHLSMRLGAAPRVLAAGDLGADGTPELVVLLADGSAWIVGEEGFRAELLLDAGRPTCALVTGDGSGLVVGYQVSRRVSCFLVGGADPPVVTGFESFVLEGPPRALAEIDVDHDGDAELCVAGAERALWVFGAGRPGGRAAWLDGAPPLEVQVGSVPIDLCAPVDDEPESALVVLGHHDLSYLALARCGDPFETLDAGYAGQSPWAAALGDLDGDGLADLAVANRGALRVGVAFGLVGGRFQAPLACPTGRGTHSVAAGDLDGDGALEIVALNALENTLVVLAEQDGRYRRTARIAVAAGSDRVRLTDLDRDGLLDACHLVQDAQGAALVVHFGDGRGGLAQRADVPPVRYGQSSGDLLATDLDADGAAEIVLSDPGSGTVVLLAGKGEGAGFRFEEPRAIDVGSGPRGLADLDVTGDGTDELLCALGGPGPRQGLALLSLRRGPDGVARLAEVTVLPTAELPFAVCACDLDGDGEDDLAILARERPDAPSGFVVPWLRNERGQWEPHAKLATGLRPHDLAAGDLDGDGRAELLVSAQNSHHVNLWRSTEAEGEPLFLRLPDLGCGTGCLDLAVADLDGDGRPDVVVANAFSNDVSVVRNLAPPR